MTLMVTTAMTAMTTAMTNIATNMRRVTTMMTNIATMTTNVTTITTNVTTMSTIATTKTTLAKLGMTSITTNGSAISACHHQGRWPAKTSGASTPILIARLFLVNPYHPFYYYLFWFA